MTMRADKLILAGLLAATLAGCGGRNDAATPPNSQTMTGQRQEDAFGTGFGIAFRQQPNDIPIVPQQGDIIAPSNTTDAVPLK